MTRPYPWNCGVCREKALVPLVKDYTAEMEHDGRLYSVTVPQLQILRCEKCGSQKLPAEASEKLEEQLRIQAGLLSPVEIRENRKRLALTQEQLASYLKVAESTVCRWERGGQIQQRSMDLLLRAFFDLPQLRQYLKR